MNILGFDTGLNKTYLALKIEDKISSKIIESTSNKYHSAFLIQEIVNMLSENDIKPQDIDLITTNIGPGSFTGIRVGLTLARCFAQAANVDTVGINSLELISSTYGLPAITILDARKSKAYAGNADKVDLIELDKLADILNSFKGKIISDTNMQDFLAEKQIQSTNFENENHDFGKVLITLAEEKYKQKQYSKWQTLKPLYIQPPPIHIKK